MNTLKAKKIFLLCALCVIQYKTTSCAAEDVATTPKKKVTFSEQALAGGGKPRTGLYMKSHPEKKKDIDPEKLERILEHKARQREDAHQDKRKKEILETAVLTNDFQNATRLLNKYSFSGQFLQELHRQLQVKSPLDYTNSPEEGEKTKSMLRLLNKYIRDIAEMADSDEKEAYAAPKQAAHQKPAKLLFNQWIQMHYGDPETIKQRAITRTQLEDDYMQYLQTQ